MFGLGMGHMLLLAAIALIAIGPKQLPEVARMIGRFLNDMKKVRDEFTRSITDTRDSVNQPFGEMFQSTYTPPPYQVDVAAQHAIAATEIRAEESVTIAHETSVEVPALDEHNQIAFDLSSPVTSPTDPDRKDH